MPQQQVNERQVLRAVIKSSSLEAAALNLKVSVRTLKSSLKSYFDYSSKIPFSEIKNICQQERLPSNLLRYTLDDDRYEANDNSRVLILSDQHAPYQHPDTIGFLSAIKNKYRPTRVINIGDEVDNHGMSFHDSDPDLSSAGDELIAARKFIRQLHKLFPKMDLVHSNHGSLLYRRGKAHGIPRFLLMSYNEMLGVDEGWQWYQDITIQLPNGQPVEFHHGRGANVGMISRRLGKSFVQGHYHSKFIIDYWGNSDQLNWGMNVGCLIDDNSLAFAYNKIPAERPIIGLGMIINSQPKLIPLVKDKNGRWNGEVA